MPIEDSLPARPLDEAEMEGLYEATGARPVVWNDERRVLALLVVLDDAGAVLVEYRPDGEDWQRVGQVEASGWEFDGEALLAAAVERSRWLDEDEVPEALDRGA